jgi:hypothetical protein
MAAGIAQVTALSLRHDDTAVPGLPALPVPLSAHPFTVMGATMTKE